MGGMVLCLNMFLATMGGEGYGVIQTVDDGKTIAVVGVRRGKDRDTYLAMAASIDKSVRVMMDSRGYVEAETKCLIGNTTVSVFVFSKKTVNGA